MEAASSCDWVDAILPASDTNLNALASMTLRDGVASIELGPADQLLVAISDRLLAVSHGNPTLVFQLPRSFNEVAITLGFALQAIRLRAAQFGAFGRAFSFTGSIVVIGMDVAVQDRLRGVQVQGVNFARGLSEALGVSRLLHDGSLVGPNGSRQTFDPSGSQFLYLNARAGWPDLPAERDGCIVIARNSMSSGDTFDKACEWAKHVQPRLVVVVDDLGDRDTEQRARAHFDNVTVLPLVDALVAQLTTQLGHGSGRSTLSTNGVAESPPILEIHNVVLPPQINLALREATAAAIVARRASSPMPFSVARATRLLTSLTRCTSDVDIYNRLAVDDPSVSSMSSLSRRLRRDDARFDPTWRSFEQGRWAGLRGGVLEAYDSIALQNPKTTALIDVLDLICRRTDVPKVVIRCAGRTASMATRETLERSASELIELLDVQFLPWSERLPGPDCDVVSIHPGAPPFQLLPILWSGDASEHVFLAYEHEIPLMRSQWLTGTGDANTHLGEIFEMLRLGSPPRWSPTLQVMAGGSQAPVEEVAIPGADLEKMMELMREFQEAEREAEETGELIRTLAAGSVEAMSLIPIRLRNGKTWWVEPDSSIDVLIGGRYHQRLTSLLAPGDQVIIPRGDGRESVFARLVAAHHRNADVADLDFLLLRFRKACMQLYERSGRNWAEVTRLMEASGAAAVHQARSWAEGSTLAPAEPRDVRLVASLVGDRNLAEGWARIAATAELLRADHQSLGRLISGALVELASGSEGPNTRNLAARMGRGAAEVLDEFAVSVVDSVGVPTSVSGTLLGVVR